MKDKLHLGAVHKDMFQLQEALREAVFLWATEGNAIGAMTISIVPQDRTLMGHTLYIDCEQATGEPDNGLTKISQTEE
jgi:hypothetical protein